MSVIPMPTCLPATDAWLKPVYVAPNTLAWEFDDAHPECETTYVVYLNESMTRPRIRLTFWDGDVMDLPTTDPHAYGTWSTPREFAEWARRYATETPIVFTPDEIAAYN